VSQGHLRHRHESSCSFMPISVFAANRPATIDARLTEGSDDALVNSFRSLRLNDGDLPLRPGFGEVGTPAKLRTNYFPVKVPKGPLHEYDVAISPSAGTSARRVKRRLFQLAEQTPDWQRAGLRGFVAHDHASKLIAAKRLSQPLEITVSFYDEDEAGPRPDGKVYILTIKFIQEIETSSLIE
jgi:eukaryotic translation initiation factor 2C